MHENGTCTDHDFITRAVGAGTSELTWQAMAGIGYEFKWCDILLVYRHLSFDEGTDQLLQNLTFSGPVLGVTLKF